MSMELVVDVLIVDDSPVDRQLAGGLVERQSDFAVGYAEDGKEALELIERQRPDIVVTDLRMPGMDGLELVRTLRHRCPQLPVVLMTALGSESIADEALREGAASYVPKCRLAQDLVPTLSDLLGRTRLDQRQERLQGCLVSCDSVYQLENDPALISALVENLQNCVVRIGFCDVPAARQLGSALEAALNNALFHGNLQLGQDVKRADWEKALAARRGQPPYRDRRIHVRALYAREEVRFIVRDEGPGFPHAERLAAARSGLVGEHGRGLTLLNTFLDQVIFNSAGNEVTLVKRCPSPQAVNGA